jgi:hypothetical protein
LYVDSGLNDSSIGCKIEAKKIDNDSNQFFFGYANEDQQSSVYAYTETSYESRMDITLTKISFKQGNNPSPTEVLKLESGIGTFGSGYGIKNNFFNLTASTTGNYILSSANSFRTTINIPTAPRTFYLPDPPSSWTGVWFGICNRSNTSSISINLQTGQQIASLQTAISSLGGGTYAQFTSDGSTWFRSG